MLANGISLPFLVASGLTVYGPLILAIVAIETALISLLLRVRPGLLVRRILLANVASTLAALVILASEQSLQEALGIRASVPTYIARYYQGVLLVILLYFLMSVIVECLVVGTKRFAARIKRSRPQIVIPVIAANVVSYGVVAPFYYGSTKPTFGHIEAVNSSGWTANPEQPVYFIDIQTGYIHRVNVDGTGHVTVVPHAATAFLLSADQDVILYKSPENEVRSLRVSDGSSTTICPADRYFDMHCLSVSADGAKVAYPLHDETTREDLSCYDRAYRLYVLDLHNGEEHEVGGFEVVDSRYDPPRLIWSNDGQLIYAQFDDKWVYAVAAEPPWGFVRVAKDEFPEPEQLVPNYLNPDTWYYGKDATESHTAFCGYGFSAPLPVALTVRRGTWEEGKDVFRLADDSGVFEYDNSGPRCPAFLPNGSEILVEWWEQLYVVDYKKRRMGLITSGKRYVAVLPRFLTDFDGSAH